jgi:26S proteasome regulatory subunit N3
MKKPSNNALSRKQLQVRSQQSSRRFTCLTYFVEIKRNFVLLERAVETIESRFTTRVLRTLPSIRRRLTSGILAQVISDYYGASKLTFPSCRVMQILINSNRWFSKI